MLKPGSALDPNHVAWSSVPSGLESLHGWKFCNVSGQPVPMLKYP